MYPYWIAAALATALGGCAACLRRPARAAFVLFLLAAAIADCGDMLHVWHGPRLLLLYDFRSVIVLLIEFIIPVSLSHLTWLLAAGKRDKLWP